jgi:hypothetical protein
MSEDQQPANDAPAPPPPPAPEPPADVSWVKVENIREGEQPPETRRR